VSAFTLQLRSQSVQIDGRAFLLREMPGSSRALFLDEVARLTKEPSAANELAGKALLLSLCLFDGPTPVKAEAVREWPAETINALFTEATKLSGLGGKDASDQGNG
jgi:hypothetical protein